MLGIMYIMINPIPEDGYDNEAIKLLKSDTDAFYEKAVEYNILNYMQKTKLKKINIDLIIILK